MCVVDETIAFMGGLDACFGRWDTPQHILVDDGEAEGAEGSQVWIGACALAVAYYNQRCSQERTIAIRVFWIFILWTSQNRICTIGPKLLVCHGRLSLPHSTVS